MGSDIILMVMIGYNSDIIFGSHIILMAMNEYNSDIIFLYVLMGVHRYDILVVIIFGVRYHSHGYE